MLILSRRIGENLMIGDDITITVVGIKGNQVRLGIEAPRHIEVHREEIYRRIQNGEGPQENNKPVIRQKRRRASATSNRVLEPASQ